MGTISSLKDVTRQNELVRFGGKDIDVQRPLKLPAYAGEWKNRVRIAMAVKLYSTVFAQNILQCEN